MTTATTARTRTDRRGRTPVQTVALVVGIVFLLVGIAGFIPGLTSDYGSMSFAGMNSMAMLLGVFQVSVLHNVVHLLFGIVGLVSSRSARASKLFLIIGGIVYAVLWIYGLVTDMGSSANFVPLNSADNWLHLVLAVGMILLGLLVHGVRRTTDAPSRA
jgi:arginine exporter protein ArgO